MTHKANQIIQLLLKFGLPLLCVLFIWHELATSSTNFEQVFTVFECDNFGLISFFLIVNLSLSGFNWFIDSLKWKTVLRPQINISTKRAIFQNLKSHSMAIFTPNRLGDYIAKAFFYDTSQRQYVVFSNAVSQFSQLLSTVFFGSIGLVYFINFTFKKLQHVELLGLGLIAVLATYIVARYHPKFRHKINRLKHYRIKFPKQISLSLIKHLVFSHQLLFILWTCGIELNYLDTIMAINVMYILSSIIPSVFIVDVAIKGSLGLLIFGYLNQDAGLILTAFSFMWLFNFALPALVGSLLRGEYTNQLKPNVTA